MLRKLCSLVETVVFACLGFLIAGFIFFVLTFYIAPAVTGIPLDSEKYFSQAAVRPQENQTRVTIERPAVDENTIPLTDSIIGEIDNAADNLIKWINQ